MYIYITVCVLSVLTSVGAVYNVWASKRNDWWKNRENIAVGPWHFSFQKHLQNSKWCYKAANKNT